MRNSREFDRVFNELRQTINAKLLFGSTATYPISFGIPDSAPPGWKSLKLLTFTEKAYSCGENLNMLCRVKQKI